MVFLMFSIGLEFSLPRLFSMKRIVFGLGAFQVLAVDRAGDGGGGSAGLGWGRRLRWADAGDVVHGDPLQAAVGPRRARWPKHGRETIGVLLFQDLAVVPLLILIPRSRAGRRAVRNPGAGDVKVVVLGWCCSSGSA